jgi:hypothetical protein
MSGTLTPQQKARKKKKKKAPGAGGQPTTPAKAPAKTKASGPTPMKEGSPAHTAMLARNKADTTLKAVFGDSKLFDDEGTQARARLGAAVPARLKFDSAKLIDLGEGVAEGLVLKKVSPQKRFTEFDQALARFNTRLEKSEEIADRIARIKTDAVTAGLEASLQGLELKDAWDGFEANIGKTDTGAAEGHLGELEARIKKLPVILAAYNTAAGPPPVARIPTALLEAAGTFGRLQTLEEGL